MVSSEASASAPSTSPDFMATRRVPASGTKESLSFATAGFSPHQRGLLSSSTWLSAANSVIRYAPVPSSSVFSVPILPRWARRNFSLPTGRQPGATLQRKAPSAAFRRTVTSCEPVASTDFTPAKA